VIRYTLKQLSYFVAAAEQESVTGAARGINVSQPAISAAISHLEQVFGVQLFLRHHAQGLSLTPAGRRILAEARNLLSHAQELPATPIGEGDPVRGALDLGCFITFSPYFVPGLLREFARLHPEVELRLHEGDAETLQTGLASGRIELAILYDLALGSHFEQETVAELPAYAVLPHDHRLAAAPTVSLAALAAEPFIMLDLPHSREYFQSIFMQLGLIPDIRYSTPSFEMVRGLVAHGHGVGLLNLRLPGDRSYDGARLACRPLREAARPLHIVLARPPGARPTRAVTTFMETARRYFAAAQRPARVEAKAAAGTAAPGRRRAAARRAGARAAE